ncbi:unnamed protein product [Caenorhabditis sp. 36 PRJEB53466]|nr:unnamed protein product [Caenorhabditis sp. 36 PRJEB53466]
MADYGLKNKLPTERLNHKVFTLSGTPHVVTSATQEMLINLHVELRFYHVMQNKSANYPDVIRAIRELP